MPANLANGLRLGNRFWRKHRPRQNRHGASPDLGICIWEDTCIRTLGRAVQLSGPGICLGTQQGLEMTVVESGPVTMYDLPILKDVVEANISILEAQAEFRDIQDFQPSECEWLKIWPHHLTLEIIAQHRAWFDQIPQVIVECPMNASAEDYIDMSNRRQILGRHFRCTQWILAPQNQKSVQTLNTQTREYS